MSADLLTLNVNEHTEKKGNLTYLSWAWAWAEVLKHDPGATWVVHRYINGDSEQPCMWIGETAMVHTTVTVKGLARECLLPVMDHKNNAMKNPDARKISDAIMRCMTKAISMHGLGLYIYAGEDLPESDEPSLVPILEASIEQAKQKKAGVMNAVLQDIHLDDMTKASLSKLAKRITPLPPAEAYQILEDNGLDSDEKTWLWSLLDSKVRSALKHEKDTRALMQHKETA